MVSRRLPGQPFGDASGLELQPEEVLVIIAETLGTFWLLGAGTGVLQVFCLGSFGNYQRKLPPPPSWVWGDIYPFPCWEGNPGGDDVEQCSDL